MSIKFIAHQGMFSNRREIHGNVSGIISGEYQIPVKSNSKSSKKSQLIIESKDEISVKDIQDYLNYFVKDSASDIQNYNLLCLDSLDSPSLDKYLECAISLFATDGDNQVPRVYHILANGGADVDKQRFIKLCDILTVNLKDVNLSQCTNFFFNSINTTDSLLLVIAQVKYAVLTMHEIDQANTLADIRAAFEQLISGIDRFTGLNNEIYSHPLVEQVVLLLGADYLASMPHDIARAENINHTSVVTINEREINEIVETAMWNVWQ